MLRPFRWWNVIAAGLALSCAGEIEDREAVLAALGDTGTSSTACDLIGATDPKADFIDPTCSTPACHDAMSAQGGLVLEGDVSGLVDAMGQTNGCETELLIDSSSAAQSLLVTILDDPPPCNVPMPFPLGGLTDEEKACVEEWVQSVIDAP